MRMTQTKVSKIVSDNIKKRIKECGYTQDKFASEVLFVDPTTLRKWFKNGIKNIDVVQEIAEKLGIDFMALFK